jgi:hypothetical protein
MIKINIVPLIISLEEFQNTFSNEAIFRNDQFDNQALFGSPKDKQENKLSAKIISHFPKIS